jgi:hypothetical protein
MSKDGIRVTVTLDGRLLIEQGRNIIELADAATTTTLEQLLDEAKQMQTAIS